MANIPKLIERTFALVKYSSDMKATSIIMAMAGLEPTIIAPSEPETLTRPKLKAEKGITIFKMNR